MFQTKRFLLFPEGGAGEAAPAAPADPPAPVAPSIARQTAPADDPPAVGAGVPDGPRPPAEANTPANAPAPAEALPPPPGEVSPGVPRKPGDGRGSPDSPADPPAPDPALTAHYRSLQRQARQLQTLMPGFRLTDALCDPRFVRLTAPEGGLSVRQAVWALCGEELQAQTAGIIADRARMDAARALRDAGRPRENGAGPAASLSPDLRDMNRDERRAYIRRKYGRD